MRNSMWKWAGVGLVCDLTVAVILYATLGWGWAATYLIGGLIIGPVAGYLVARVWMGGAR